MSEKSFLIVNPKGIMHVVSEAHARWRLNNVGWRLANEEEKKAYFAAGGNQKFDAPLAKPFSPAPLLEQALSETDILPNKKAVKGQGNKTEVASAKPSNQREVSE